MASNNFFNLLDTLNKKEVDGFIYFLKGNYPEKKKLVSILENVRLEGDSWKKTFYEFAQLKGNLKTLQNQLPEFYSLLKSFLATRELLSVDRELERSRLAISAIRKRKDYTLFLSEVEAEVDQIKRKDRSHNPWDFMQLALLRYDSFFHPNFSKLENGGQYLTESIQYLDVFYVSLRLKIVIEIFNREQLINSVDRIEFVDEFIRMNQERKTLSQEVSHLYRSLIEFVQKRDDAKFYELKNLLTQGHLIIPNYEYAILFFYLINYATYKIKSGLVKEYSNVQFVLYKYALEKDILTLEHTISETTFINIVELGCVCEEIDWLKDTFVPGYEKMLPSENRELSIAIAAARVAFEEGNFEKGLDLEAVRSFPNAYLNIRIRVLIIKCSYELRDHSDYEGLLEKKIRMFLLYLKNEEDLGNATRKAAKTFIECIKDLYNRNPNDKERKNRIRKRLTSSEFVFAKIWLEEKLKEQK